jgi:hypothetical protein
MVRSYLIFIIILLFLSCNDDDTPRLYRIAKIKSLDTSLIQSKEEHFSNKKFTWNTPTDWIENKINKSSLRLASYAILLNNGESADLSITKFSGNAGGVLSNVNRWRGQLDLSHQTLDVIESSSLKGKSKLGDFSIYQINNDALDKAFLCMILQLPSETIFAKLSSSSIGVKFLKQDFINFCNSFRLVKYE